MLERVNFFSCQFFFTGTLTLQFGHSAHPAVQAVEVKQQARLVRLKTPPILKIICYKSKYFKISKHGYALLVNIIMSELLLLRCTKITRF